MLEEQAAALLNELLAECVRLDASDLHLAPGLPPYLRVEGILEPQEHRPRLAPAEIEAVAAWMTRDLDQTPLRTTGSLDGALTGKSGARYRFNVFRRQGQLAISIRQLEDRFRTLPELGLSESLYRMCDLPDGLIVVAGPTGAGKSTTLAAFLDRINQTRRCHLITIEDPIEYVHTSKTALVNQRQVGTDTCGFYEALVASLREDPDVILVGEIRDLNTIRTAIVAAETGHLVFTTVHAGDCVGAIERLVAVFPADEQDGIRRQMSLVLRAVIAQHLLVADGPAGGRSFATTPQREQHASNQVLETAVSTRRTRVVTSEVLVVTPAVANLIATAKSNQIYSAMEAGGAAGMQTLEQDLARLWVGGRISEMTAVAMAKNPNVLRDRVARMRSAGRGG
ncbi:MAG: Flp pilus assembly complex ATPase component TadA [Pirellulaceae bacterium]|nr:Flp pilus assembly complex ATPase component TadA [Pirellulaceae bacterium]